MAGASYRAELTCQVCLDIFTEPVSLTCGHSFCRECVSSSPEHRCPSCQEVYRADLTTNLTLKKLADTVKDDIKNQGSSLMCAEHEEKLKLFCETDQELVCVICRDGAKHDGHKFKPIKEAAQIRRKVQEDTMQLLIGQNRTTEDLIKKQESEKTKLKKKTQQLKIQISCQFDEMQQFLKKRQKEIQEALEAMNKEALEEMEANLEMLKTHLSEGREKENQMRSRGDDTEPVAFLKWWTENMKEQQPTEAKMTLVPECLCFSPYNSHLQILVWKEMLQIIKPLPDKLGMKPNSQNLIVSGDGRSIYSNPNSSAKSFHTGFHSRQQDSFTVFNSGQQDGAAFGFGFRSVPNTSTTRFHSGQPDCAVSKPFPDGQHYWEVEVGLGALWEVGVMHNNFVTALRYDGQQYLIKQDNRTALPLAPVKDAPRKIGVYLDCEASKLLFYNADKSKIIHALEGVMNNPAPYCAVGYNSVSPDPLKICWY